MLYLVRFCGAARIAEEVRPRMAAVRIRITGVPPGREPTVTVGAVISVVVRLVAPLAPPVCRTW